MRKLLQILSAVGMLVYSGQFEAFGAPPIEDDAVIHRRAPQPQPTDTLTNDALRLVLAQASKDTLPVELQLVCKSWRNVMRENNPIQKDLKFGGLNSFMKTCMNLYWAEQFKNGILRYTDPRDATKVINLKFCDAPKGTFDISQCGDTNRFLRMTLSVDEFLKVKGDNKNKIVILFAERQMIDRFITTSAQPFVEILKGWDPSFPFGTFWKWGNDKEFYTDYLTYSGVKQISSCNIYENWKKSIKDLRASRGDLSTMGFHVYFVNQN